MRDLPIAYGNSCYAKTWANKTTTWKDLCKRLKTTIRTTESVEEYPKLTKEHGFVDWDTPNYASFAIHCFNDLLN